MSFTNKPLVSIGMPVYNEERHIAEALDSLLAQDYRNFELVISDNASTDSTREICERYAARDARVRYERSEANVGGTENFNRAFRLSRGEFFMWCAGHDVWRPTFISRCLESLLEDEAVVLCYPRFVWIDAEGRELEPIHGYVDTRGMKHRLARFNAVIWGLGTAFAVNGLFRSGALKRTQLFRQLFAPDVALLAETALLGEFACAPEVLMRARKPDDYGSWEAYLQKHFLKLPRRSVRRLYWRMMSDLIRSVTRHGHGYGEVAIAAISVPLCMLTKYRWILTGLSKLRAG